MTEVQAGSDRPELLLQGLLPCSCPQASSIRAQILTAIQAGTKEGLGLSGTARCLAP